MLLNRTIRNFATLGVTLITVASLALTACGGGSSGVTTTPPPNGGTTVPSAPTGVSLISVNANRNFTIAWNSVTGATGYNIYRSTTSPVEINPSNKINPSPIASTSTSFTDNNTLAASTLYYYRVTALNAAGEGSASGEASSTTAAAGVSPTVTGFSPISGVVGTTITITGTNLNSYAFPPMVMFGTTPSPSVTAAGSGNSVTAEVPNGLALGNHAVTIGAINGTLDGITGTAIPVGTFEVVVAPPPAATGPVGLTPTVLAFNQISLTWTANATSAYLIYRSTTPNFTVSGANLINSHSGQKILLGSPYVDNNLSAATTYYYKITEIPAGGSESQPSTQVSATTNALSGIVGVDWLNNPIGTGAGITSVVWSGTQYVAVDMIGKAHVSTDAITWTSYNTGVILPLTAVTWSGTQFVAVGQTGSVVTSPDGITWTVQTSGSNSYLFEVTWSGTQFVAVGGNSTVLTSPDGITWTLQNSSLQVIASLTSVTWSGSQFVAVSSGGHVITSTDGVIWSTATSFTTNNLQSVVWNGSKFFAVGAGGQVLSSPDGTTWSQAAIGNSTTLNSLIWTGQQFIATGNSGVILRSPDGVTWTTAPSGTTLQLNSITGSGNTYVIVGNGVALKSL
ncbi:MAG: fibronectin type III domain-containing protein [Sideroxydans sp.]|nr:fibronectin type III domain-containing protein [Sideroxydans sp.]